MPASRARLVAALLVAAVILPVTTHSATPGRERISIDDGWRFSKDDPPGTALTRDALVPWLLPTSNGFVSDPAKRKGLPAGSLDGGPYARRDFDDRSWRLLDLPHDWGVEGTFSATGSGARGRLPFYGVAWYRRTLDVPATDAGRSIFLDVDGAIPRAAPCGA